jgi:hypothetical protein
MTLYQMHDIVQSNSLNPSVASNCEWNIGFPLLGNISIAAGSPIAYKDLDIGKEYVDGNKIVSLMNNTNLFSSNISLNVLTIGYRTENTYYQFTMNEKASAKVLFSKELVGLMFHGNGQYVGNTVNANAALSVSLYSEYGFNVAHQFGEDFWLGARAKLMFGKIGANSPSNSMSLYTDPLTYALTLKSDLFMDMSMPGTVQLNPESGTVKSFNSTAKVKDLIFNPVNAGGAIDIGLNKSFESGLKISASVLNIGMINWTKNTHQFYRKRTVNYSGPSPQIRSWKNFVDTIGSIVKLDYTENQSFSQWLTPEIMFGFSYPVIEYMRLGVTGYAGISSVGTPWAVTATAFTNNTSMVYGVLSYTVSNNSITNVGGGLGFRIGAFNIHAMTDNLMALFNPTSSRYGSFQFGINFQFGCGDGDNSRSSGKYRSVPCPSFGYSSKSSTKSVPCPSGRR